MIYYVFAALFCLGSPLNACENWQNSLCVKPSQRVQRAHNPDEAKRRKAISTRIVPLEKRTFEGRVCEKKSKNLLKNSPKASSEDTARTLVTYGQLALSWWVMWEEWYDPIKGRPSAQPYTFEEDTVSHRILQERLQGRAYRQKRQKPHVIHQLSYKRETVHTKGAPKMKDVHAAPQKADDVCTAVYKVDVYNEHIPSGWQAPLVFEPAVKIRVPKHKKPSRQRAYDAKIETRMGDFGDALNPVPSHMPYTFFEEQVREKARQRKENAYRKAIDNMLEQDMLELF